MTLIDGVFGSDGLLSGRFEGYAPRRGQVDMAKAVERAIAEKGHLIAEGPTGTGKSLAYLVPAIQWAASDPRLRPINQPRAIVVTGNIALQEQLVQKDLPLLEGILPERFRFALAKGRNNYLCLDSLSKTLAEGALGVDPALARLLAWAQETETGDVSEFPEQVPAPIWRRVSVGAGGDECKGNQCRFYQNCFAEIAKRSWGAAHVIVTNYHMFFAHLRVREKMKELQAKGANVELDVVLPPAGVVIFDEAHKAADIARDFLGFQVTKGSLDWLLRGFNHETSDRARAACEAFMRAMNEHRRSKAYRARLRRGHPLGPAGEELARALADVGAVYKREVSSTAWSQDQKAELQIRAQRASTLSEQIREAMRPEENAESVYFMEESAKGDPILRSKPIEVAGWMERELFGEFDSVIVTSATLSTGAGGGFDFVRGELGIPEEAREMTAESPFSWGDQVIVCVPETMTDPSRRDEFPHAVARHVKQACQAARGRTLGLFTSYRVLEEAHRACQTLPYRVFRQGEAPRTMLVQRFKDDVSSVLLGCESFWAGVDVPGESLSCVVIDRLPFPTPDDPIADAISERDDRWFFTYAIPRAIIQLKQGFGRLIRTTSDRGAVVILDRRVVDKGYGRQFLRALPAGIGMTDDLDDVRDFLGDR